MFPVSPRYRALKFITRNLVVRSGAVVSKLISVNLSEPLMEMISDTKRKKHVHRVLWKGAMFVSGGTQEDQFLKQKYNFYSYFIFLLHQTNC